ncbi:MAG: acetylglutamate kinase [Clostridiales bacterium]|nr:acetylglutamate kinase [Clostridiales bacterium]
MDKNLEEIEEKASILIGALPYIRDFAGRTIVIEYGCAEWLSGMQEQSLMKDIVLLKSVGMRPVVVHHTRMGMDKFRENKRIAKLLELCGRKAIGICGIDLETIGITLDHDYIPVIVPNDIDNEAESIDPLETACEVAVKTGAEKLICLCRFPGVFTDESRTDVFPLVTIEEMETLKADRGFPEEFVHVINPCIRAVEQGVGRSHILDGRIEHVLPIELFSVDGAGTAIIQNRDHLYAHERSR